jgi:hypothetical protein
MAYNLLIYSLLFWDVYYLLFASVADAYMII